MPTHQLKCWPEFFDAVASGQKTFEVRKNDRGYQAGDTLILRAYDPHPMWPGCHWVSAAGDRTIVEEYAATVTVRVSYVLSGMGIEPGYVCMAIERVRPDSALDVSR